MTVIEIHLPIRTVSEANVREHWAVRAKRAKEQRTMAALMLKRWRFPEGHRYIVTLTRVGKRNLDTDNCARSFKSIRDGIADAMGIDDGSARIVWRYEQARGDYGVKVNIQQVNGDV